MYPYLCMVHRHRKDESGVPAPGLVHADNTLMVCPINIFDLVEQLYSPEELSAKVIEYPTLEALLRDWKVN